MLHDNIRSVDRLARYGGEELAVIMPETTAAVALDVAEDLRQLVAYHPFAFETKDEAGEPQVVHVPITISLGVAGIPDNAFSAEALINAADFALYEAKRRGRNCAVEAREVRSAFQPTTPLAM
jgi:diguanylate cyclase (GGDEF)-like protein